MSGLAEFHADLRRFLLEGGEPGPALRGVDRRRLALYAEFVARHRESIVGLVYPVVKQVLPKAQWERLKAAYYAEHPISHWEFNANAEAFAAFLAERADELPAFVPQLADYEWLDFAIATGREEVVREGPLRPNPTAVLRECAFDLPAWLRPEPRDPAGPPRRDLRLLLYRHPEQERTFCVEARSEVLLALKLATERVSPDDVARQTGLPSESVRSLVRRGCDEGWLLAAKV